MASRRLAGHGPVSSIGWWATIPQQLIHEIGPADLRYADQYAQVSEFGLPNAAYDRPTILRLAGEVTDRAPAYNLNFANHYFQCKTIDLPRDVGLIADCFGFRPIAMIQKVLSLTIIESTPPVGVGTPGGVLNP